ncbi:MAG: dihydrolipoamide acetyltransferase component of pyruvate dehydrogenase complex [Herpetosiphonaceae bacterium]|nr:MAG: dihydrolipoamide acetyltransferase component of pyruvate dehydrogenase complex [Herpetosiphonaceae bacterium]
MPIEFKMPKLGESVTEGTVSRWLKQAGDRVELYEPMLEVTTDKVDTEVSSPVNGTLLEIRVPEGETVPVGAVIAILAAEDEAAANGTQPTEEAQAPVAKSAQASVQQRPVEIQRPERPAGDQAQGFISPAVARLAAEHNVDLSQITGTGRNGRITKQDVQRYIEERSKAQQPASAAQPAATAAQPAVRPTPPAEERISAAPVPQPAAAPAVLPPALLEGDELVPLTAMRRAIAEHMVRSKRTSPHVTTVMEADLSRIVAYREAHKAEFERQGAKLTFTPFFVYASVRALQEVPIVNATYTDEGILMHRAINIGVAVAIPEGLVVPVVHNADEKSLLGLSRAVNDLADRARSRRLQQNDVEGGTFTITNHGVSGSIFAMPIINQPQAAILGVGAIQKRPVVITQHGVDAIAIRPMCYLSLTFDHRLIDGATADQFLAVIKRELEEWKE